jgi:hypothetical protein
MGAQENYLAFLCVSRDVRPAPGCWPVSRGLIAVDLVARVNVRESINRERDWSDSNGIGEQAMEKLGRSNNAFVVGNT